MIAKIMFFKKKAKKALKKLLNDREFDDFYYHCKSSLNK